MQRLMSGRADVVQTGEPRNPAVPRTLDSLHGSLDGLGQQITQLADRLKSILSSPGPQGANGNGEKTSTGCEVSDMVHHADEKVETLRRAVDDLMSRLQV